MATEKYTFEQFKAEYPDDAACLDEIMRMRYGGTQIRCPGCERPSKFHRITKRRAYACQHCGEHIFPCANTIYEKSRTPLTKWFYAMFLFISSRHGVPARELERQLGVTYKCAWRMAHEIRKLMERADNASPLSGHVEIDESYVGGRPRKGRKNERGRSRKRKAVVIGMVERNGKVKAEVIENIGTETIENAITSNVAPGSRLSTDELFSYRDIGRAGYDHQTVRHGSGEYVRGDVHTNSIEGYWSRLKNSICGTHIHVSKKHLWKYVSEFSYRYNRRKTPHMMFRGMVLALALPRPQKA
jgi:transposase-like protein